MRTSLALLMGFAGIMTANPYLEYIQINEFETKPQYFERIELEAYLPLHGFPVEVGGSVIVTNAGTAVVDSGVCFDTWPYEVVLDSTNTTGTFSLGDDSDYIRVYVPYPGGSDTFKSEVRYPSDCWAPPQGASASRYSDSRWYVDVSPTFGAYNNDYNGGIAGRVLDRSGHPLEHCLVRFETSYGKGYAGCDSMGRYVMCPLGLGIYQVSAHSDSNYLPAYYPEPCSIGVNGWLDSINMTMYPAGAAEERLGTAFLVSLRQRGRTLVLNADRPGGALVTVFDNLGRARLSEKIALAAGSNELALPGISSGVYFVNCRLGERALKTKLVLY